MAGDSGTGDQVTTSNSDTALLTSQAGGGEIFTYHHQQPTAGGNFQENKKASVNLYLYISNPYDIILDFPCSFDIQS